MFWKAKPTINEDDLEWQLLTWDWLLTNLGGLREVNSHRTAIPSSSDFPSSGTSGADHASFVFRQVADRMRVNVDEFVLEAHEASVDPILNPHMVVQNTPVDPLGTYSRREDSRHIVTYSPTLLEDLEGLIATFAHEICHPVLLSIPTEPPGEDTEEFATDLAVCFFGFGIFGGNASFSFQQFSDTATGSRGWSTKQAGYLTQNEWGFALAVRDMIADGDGAAIRKHGNSGLSENYRRNRKFLEKNPALLSEYLGIEFS